MRGAVSTLYIDITRLAARRLERKQPTGVDRVSQAYIEHYGAQAQALIRHWGRWIAFDPIVSQRLFDAVLGNGTGAERLIRMSVAAAYPRPARLRRGAILFNTGHSGLDLPGYAAHVRQRQLRPVYFLHDLLPLTHPEFFRDGEADLHRRRLRTMAETGHGLVLNSTSTERDLVEHASAAKLALPPYVIAPLCPARLPTPRDAAPVKGPYFVVLGTIEPRKNHLLLLQIWRELARRAVQPMPKLVIVGRRGWECEQVLDLLDRCEGLRDHVVERASCDDAELATWLHHARALLFPSFVEGFGLPLVEALAHGLPVIASDLPIFREVAGDIPDYVDALDGAGWYQILLGYLQPLDGRRAAQIERLRGFVPSTWPDHFEQVDRLLQHIRPAAAV